MKHLRSFNETNFQKFIKESTEQEEIKNYWDRQLRQIPNDEEKQREIKRVTADIINARRVADNFLSFLSTKTEDEFNQWVNKNPYDAVKMQNELEDHSYTKELWWYGFDRTKIPYNKKTIDEYLYDLLTTDIDKIKEKYK